MSHKIIAWLGGILYVRATGRDVERFVNLCRNHGIFLWKIAWEENRENLYFYISLHDFYKLRRIVRKSKVFLVVKKRVGFPFFIRYLNEHMNFLTGILCLCLLWLLLSARIWSIRVSGQSYHTTESIVKFLNTEGVYGGMAKSELSCKKVRELLRKKYKDIGWISVEELGCFIHIRIKEVQMKEKKQKGEKGHLVAERDGKVISIVTRAGTAKVKAGKKVKKGDVLIAGIIKIRGDGDELVETDYVHADGDVILKEEENYCNTLKKSFQKKEYTGREKKLFEWNVFSKQFFLYNPLNYLESYKKYDIIREGGVLYPEISIRFPVQFFERTYKEVDFFPAKFNKKEAEDILSERYADYISEKKEQGYKLVKSTVALKDAGNSYVYDGKLIFYKKQTEYRLFHLTNK